MPDSNEGMGKRWEELARKYSGRGIAVMHKPNKYKDRSKYDGNGNLKRVKYGEGRRWPKP